MLSIQNKNLLKQKILNIEYVTGKNLSNSLTPKKLSNSFFVVLSFIQQTNCSHYRFKVFNPGADHYLSLREVHIVDLDMLHGLEKRFSTLKLPLVLVSEIIVGTGMS